MSNLPATIAVTLQHKADATHKVERYQGVVVSKYESEVGILELCPHKHKYEDLAMTCARRLRNKRLTPFGLR